MVANTETVTRKASIEIFLSQRKVSRFALVAQLASDVRLAEAVPLAVVRREDPAGIARTWHAIRKLTITGCTLVALVSRITRFAITSACYLKHDRCLTRSRLIWPTIIAKCLRYRRRNAEFVSAKVADRRKEGRSFRNFVLFDFCINVKFYRGQCNT